MDHRRFIAPLLLILTLTAFWRVPACQFVNYDDNVYVTENQAVRQGLTRPGITWAFTTTAAGNYHPLTWLSLMLDSSLMGPGPRGYHMTNLLLHVAGVLLLYAALRALTGSAWRSGVVAALFAIHPLRVESVAWVSERKDLLCACLGFAALWCYARYVQRPSWRPYVGVVLLMALGLLAKPMLVTLPFVLLLLDFWPLRRPRREADAGATEGSLPARSWARQSWTWLVMEKLPLLALSIASSVVTYIAQHRASAVHGLGELSLGARLGNVAVALVRYLEKMVWFRGLIIDYPFRPWAPWQVVLSVVLLVAITIAVVWHLRAQPWLSVGWFWFLGTMVPVIGLVQVGNQAMADRYTYIPTIGLLIAVVWSFPSRLLVTQRARVAVGAALAAILVLLGAATWHQIGYWHDSVALFRHVVDVEPDHEIALVNLGVALGEAGDHDGALRLLCRAAQVGPTSPQAQTNLGMSLLRHGLVEEALQHLHLAVQLQPNRAPPHDFLGLAEAAAGQLDAAIAEYRVAIQLDPGAAAPYGNLARALARQSKFGEAPGAYQSALQLNPDNPGAYLGVAATLSDMGRPLDALPFFAEAIRRQPEAAVNHAALAQALLKMRRMGDAEAELQKAVTLEPGNAMYRGMLERVSATEATQRP